MSGAALEARGLLHSYPAPGGRLPVLDVPALALAAGDTLAITGPSGSGKTTLLHVLAGIERPERGHVAWDGTDVAALPEAARDRFRRSRIGLVFQDFQLVEAMSPLENVLLPLRFGSFALPAGARGRATALLDRLGVRVGGTAAVLSRGEMQRVAIARALVGTPAILLADEPTASLDRSAADEVAGQLFALAAEHRSTLVVVTHDERLAGRCRRRCRLAGGALEAAA